MSDELSIELLSKSDKLVLMERLWADLSHCPEELPPPNWHGDVLAKRIAAVNEGSAKFVDWNEAKQRLRDTIS